VTAHAWAHPVKTRPSPWIEYLCDELHRGGPIGDLAEDWLRDRHAPSSVESRGELLAYLRQRRACAGALRAARRAWRTYAGGASR